ncbi:MAG: antitermination protein NusG [Pirellulales bacterium]|nr:antitermination protein NusG [Pirellulales bacterium]
MPILAAETSIYPDDLLSHSAHGLDSAWWALYTKPRQEKSLARQLLKARIPFFLPLVPRARLYRGSRRESYVPLFTGYLFLCGTDEQRLASLTTNRVVQAIPVKNAAELVEDLKQIERLIASRAPLTVEKRLLPGQHVRIRAGALAGLEGTILFRRRESRLLVVVRFLQQGVSVDLDDFMLERID